MKYLGFVFLSFFVLQCVPSNPMVGGPCSYKTSHNFTGMMFKKSSTIASYEVESYKKPINIRYTVLQEVDSLFRFKMYKVLFQEIESGSCNPYAGSIKRVYEN